MTNSPYTGYFQRGSMLWGFLLVRLGLFAMVTPAISGIAATFMLAALLLISGFATVIFAFGSESFGSGVLRFLFGGITVLAALWMFGNPGMALASLTLFLAIYFFVDGIFSIGAGFTLPEGKGWVIFNGIVSVLLGVMIWRNWPVSGMWAVGILLGVKMVVGGMALMAIESVKDSAKKQLGA
jgi:uncharacterized membrane protein HdeD (DUF308 family)